MKRLTINSFAMRHLLIAVSFAIPAPTTLAGELDNTLQINLPETLVDSVPESDSFTSSIQPTSENETGEDLAITSIDDPWEGFNRSIYGFNLKADKYVLKPVALAYNKITPKPVQKGVSNFFANLKAPTSLINELLQGRPTDSAKTLGRLTVNTTVGVLGIFDPASAIGLERRNEDFGQTLAVWGWDNSKYVVIPLLGPFTMRDVVGFIGDTPVNPMNYADGGSSAALQSLEITDMRTQMMPMDDLRASAIDEYIMVRHAWSQGRNQEIRDGTELQAHLDAKPEDVAGKSILQRIFQ